MFNGSMYFQHEICENSRNVQRLLLLLIEELEALPADNGWAALVVLLLGDPHLLEGGKGRQDGASIQTEYFLSGGAMILILMVDGARAVISFCIRSAIPGYMVVPPDMTVLAYKSFLMSTSHFMMEL